jgi:pyruvate dehydrogenase E1 component
MGPLIARDIAGLLLKRMEEAVDGEYQTFKSKDGAYCANTSSAVFRAACDGRQHVRRRYLAAEPWRARPHKVYAAPRR